METERENSNQKTSILKDSSIRSIWTICVKRGLVKGKERERERERERQRERERERERRYRHRQRKRERDTHTHTHRDRQSDRETDISTERERDRQTETHTHTDRQTQRETEFLTSRQLYRESNDSSNIPDMGEQKKTPTERTKQPVINGEQSFDNRTSPRWGVRPPRPVLEDVGIQSVEPHLELHHFTHG